MTGDNLLHKERTKRLDLMRRVHEYERRIHELELRVAMLTAAPGVPSAGAYDIQGGYQRKRPEGISSDNLLPLRV